MSDIKKVKAKPKSNRRIPGKPMGPSDSNPFKSRFFIFAVISLFALYLAGQIALSAKTEVIPYSEFKTEIKAGRLHDVLIARDRVTAKKMQEGKEVNVVALRVEDDTLVPLLDEKGLKFEAQAEGGWLSETLWTWVIPMVLVFFIWQFFLGRAFRQGPPGLMAFGKSRAKLITHEREEKTSFKDVAGCDEAKEELLEVVDFLKTPERFRAIGGRIPKGVLLVGPPGTGKTLLARAVAGEAAVNFYSISGSDFVEMFVGVGAARVRDLFAEAQKNSPCIIFIDELDAIAKSRQTVGFQSNDEREQTLNQILVEMDGFDNHAGVIIMAATNRPEVLDPAIVRPGRFDRQIVVERPDLKGRFEILVVHAKKIKMEEGIDLKSIAARTPGFSGADLANLVNESALLAVRKGLSLVSKECFEEAIDRLVAGLERKSKVISPSDKRTIAVHEVGHALVARFTPGSDKVHRISIIPRSSGALGFTMQIPEEDRHLMTKKQLLNMIRVLLGGRASESVVIGEVTSGAQDDLRRASAIVRRMITEFGMGESLGLVSLSSQAPGYMENPFIRDDSSHVSNEVTLEIDREIRKILDNEFQKASDLLSSHRPLLDKLVERLLEKETLESEDFDELVNKEINP